MNSGQLLNDNSELAPRNQRPLANAQRANESRGGTGTELNIGDYWRILLKRKWTILSSIIVVVTVAAIVTWRTTPIYDGAVRLSFSERIPNVLKDEKVEQSYSDPYAMDTQIRVIQSNAIALLVIHDLRLDRRPEFAGQAAITTVGGVGMAGPALSDLAREERLITILHKNLRVSQVGNSGLIEVRYSSPNPQLAAEIANAFAKAHIEGNIKARFDSTMQATEWLSKQLADLQIKMETSQGKLVEYQKQHNIVGTDDKQNLITEKLNQINHDLATAQADRIQKESLYRIAEAGNVDALSAALQDGVLTTLRQQRMEARTQYAQLATQFGSSYPKVRELENRLAELDRAFQDQLKHEVRRLHNDYEAASNRERMVQAALDVQTAEANKLNENAIQYKFLKQEADSNRQLYEGLLQKLKEASLLAGLNASNIRIVDMARVPLHPARPNIPRNMGFAVLLGLVGGVAAAFVLETLDVTVRTPDQAENASGLPSMGVIPLYGAAESRGRYGYRYGYRYAYGYGYGARRSRALQTAPEEINRAASLITLSSPKSEISEAYRGLRTSILLSSAGQPPKTVLFTSALPREGKTMTSTNVAVVMAQQSKRVLLIDADLRRPSQHKVFGLRPEAGLSSVLTGTTSVADAIVTTAQSNLDLMPAGPVPPHPSELLSSGLMQELMQQWRQEYDYIVIDSPPVLSVTDAVLLSVKMDTVVLVVRAGQTTTMALRRARDLLQFVQANLMGVVVNAVDLSSPDYYYYYSGYRYSGYRYVGKYGYGQYYSDKDAPTLKVDAGTEETKGEDSGESRAAASKTSS